MSGMPISTSTTGRRSTSSTCPGTTGSSATCWSAPARSMRRCWSWPPTTGRGRRPLEHLALLDALGVAPRARRRHQDRRRRARASRGGRRGGPDAPRADVPVVPVRRRVGDRRGAARSGRRSPISWRRVDAPPGPSADARDRPRVLGQGSRRRRDRHAARRAARAGRPAAPRARRPRRAGPRDPGPRDGRRRVAAVRRTALNLAGDRLGELHRGVVLTADPRSSRRTGCSSPSGRPCRAIGRAWRLHAGTAAVDAAVGRRGPDATGCPDAGIVRLGAPVAVRAGRSVRAAAWLAPRRSAVAPRRRRRPAGSRDGARPRNGSRPSASGDSPTVRLDLHGASSSGDAWSLAPDVRARGGQAAVAAVTDSRPEGVGLGRGPDRGHPAPRRDDPDPRRRGARRDPVIDGLVAEAAGSFATVTAPAAGGRGRAPPDPDPRRGHGPPRGAAGGPDPAATRRGGAAAGCPPRASATWSARPGSSSSSRTSPTRCRRTATSRRRRSRWPAASPLTPAAYRDATGTSRKYVMAILEDLDRRAILRRTPDGHVPGPQGARAVAAMTVTETPPRRRSCWPVVGRGGSGATSSPSRSTVGRCSTTPSTPSRRWSTSSSSSWRPATNARCPTASRCSRPGRVRGPAGRPGRRASRRAGRRSSVSSSSRATCRHSSARSSPACSTAWTDADRGLPRRCGRRPRPLPMAVRRGSWAGLADGLLAAGERRLRALLAGPRRP